MDPEQAVCPECGEAIASRVVPHDSWTSPWWTVPALISVLLICVVFLAVLASGTTTLSGLGQASASWLAGTPLIANERLVKTVTLADLRLAAAGDAPAPLLPSEMRLRADRRFRMDAVEAPLYVGLESQVGGSLGSDWEFGWPVPWLLVRHDRKSSDLLLPPKPGAPIAAPTVSWNWLFTKWLAQPTPELSTAVLLLHTRMLVPPALACVLIGIAMWFWQARKGRRAFPVSLLPLFLVLSALFYAWPSHSSGVLSHVATGNQAAVPLKASQVFAMDDSPESARALCRTIVDSIEKGPASISMMPETATLYYGYSEFPPDGSAKPRRAYSVLECSFSAFNLFRLWDMTGDTDTPAERFVYFTPMRELYIRMQSPGSIRLLVISYGTVLALLALCFSPMLAVRLYRSIRAQRLALRDDRSQCRHCGYSLAGAYGKSEPQT